MTKQLISLLSEALGIAERRRQDAQRLSGVGYWELDHQQQSLYWSEEIYAIYELPDTELEPDYALFLSLIYDEDREFVDSTYQTSVTSGTEYNIRYRIKAANSVKWLEARGVTYYDHQGAPERSIGCAQDITEIVTAQQQIERLAYHDALTDLANRQLFAKRMNTALQKAQRDSSNLAVLFIDLDNFKLINDRHGHDVGDEVLVGVANRLRSCARVGDTFARIGGDEFAGVLIGIDDTLVDDAVRNVKHAIDGAYQTRLQSFDVTASIGVTLYPQDCADPDILLRHADQAMYDAKERGRSRVRYFDTERHQSNWSRRELLKDIEIAIQTDQFELYLQPRVSFRDGTLAGAEALLRWLRPQGAVSPSDVIAAISGTTLEWELDSWVITKVLSLSKGFRERGINGPFSLNINPSSIENPDFPEHLSRLLADGEGSGENLEIEILEISSIENFEGTNEILCRCKALGISFSLDDFGTGYSSLTHFHSLPIDKLKIDQRFIKRLDSDRASLALVKSILAIAKANNRPVVAEGVESHAIACTLASLGCEYGQGFGLARPMPANDYIAWAEKWDPAAFAKIVSTPASQLLEDDRVAGSSAKR
ncbi:putative bifunctional diguanylate cyclase/phosphodiesterase [Thiorhodovibrio frisius]|uniref:PAS domain S-box/diguanylate cyclase (GGDEF) domain-containing protein n=1 Tax=Thiorhodovibrio frisius TaxID=631362 RepID=H8Z397_9GAMM|nr:GGDEF domain-containing phosphodiesterase [Thiorhodovibrio frisius]EIC21805.1 PAS domain S-box/diguanylate cyclase (GGDEF) domain-containing protein [Thiorhodovibrio frisius]WPL21775.1 Cyclic di-GMP phosphodiesterase Gmr [Thiorhodovibrio frisius]